MRDFAPSLILILGIAAQASAQATIPIDQLTISGVEAFAKRNRITSVDSLLQSFPDLLRKNYVLVSDSKSRQSPSTVSRPRIIMYLPDGSFFASIATNNDPERPSNAYGDVEMLEFQKATGTWHLGAFDPSKQLLHTAGKTVGEELNCKGCHGDSSRPIWGAYPNWPGVYANNNGTPDSHLSADEADALNRALTPDGVGGVARLQKLVWELPRDKAGNARLWREADSLGLPDRRRNGINECMNDSLGTQHMKVLWDKVSKTDQFDLLMLTVYLHLFEDNIQGIPAARERLKAKIDFMWMNRPAHIGEYPRATTTDKALLLMGLDNQEDLVLSDIADQTQEPSSMNIGYWSMIAINLRSMLVVRYTEHLIQTHPQLRVGEVLNAFTYGYPPHTTIKGFAFHRRAYSYMYEMNLDDRVTFQNQNPDIPTVGLRFEYLFTTEVQNALTPILIKFADQQILVTGDK